MAFHIKDGKVVNDEGEVLKVGEEEIAVEGAFNQDDIDKSIKQRLAKETKKFEALKTQADKNPELQKMYEEARNEKEKLQKEYDIYQTNAKQKQDEQTAQYKTQNESLQNSLKEEKVGRMRDQVTNNIIGVCANKFINAQRDVAPALMNSHERTFAKDAAGNDIQSNYKDQFKISIYNEDTDTAVDEMVDLNKAVTAFANDSNNAHYLQSKAIPGSNANGDINRDGDQFDRENATSQELINAGLRKRMKK